MINNWMKSTRKHQMKKIRNENNYSIKEIMKVITIMKARQINERNNQSNK